MRLIQSFSTVLVGALLASSALGELTKVARSGVEQGLETRNDKGKGPSLGPDPRDARAKELFSKYCSKPPPVKKGGSKPPAKKGGKRSIEQTRLEARVQPAGYTPVGMDGKGSSPASGPGLWTGGVATCVAIAVTGRSTSATAHVNFLVHIAMHPEWKKVTDQFDQLSAAVRGQGLSQLRGYILVIDTTLNSDVAEVKNDPDVKDSAASLEKAYGKVEHWLQNLVGANPVARLTHPYAQGAEMQVTPAGVVTRTLM